MSAQFHVGDQVVHVFGGPVMVVASFESAGVWCEWLQDGHPHSHQFPMIEIVHTTNAEAPRKCVGRAA